MKATLKICLYPTKEQETKFKQFCGIARFVYNWGLARKIKEYTENGITYYSSDLIHLLKAEKVENNCEWIDDAPLVVLTRSLQDLDLAYDNFFKRGNKGFPKFKKKGRCKESFYQRLDRIHANSDNTLTLTKIGKVKIKESDCKCFPEHPLNPRVHFDGKHWYLTVVADFTLPQVELTDVSLGVDLGVKHLAVRSDGVIVENINKSKHIKRLKKRLLRLQRQVSRKYEMNKEGAKFKKTKNICKLEHEIRLIYRTITNIRETHLHTATADIVKTKPYRVVVEDLNVAGMLKNRNLSKAIAEECFNKFLLFLEYKCYYWGIEFVKADRYFASSKICSNCGCIKHDLKLSDRTYICEDCGMIKDRDKNASDNLSNYQLNIA